MRGAHTLDACVLLPMVTQLFSFCCNFFHKFHRFVENYCKRMFHSEKYLEKMLLDRTPHSELHADVLSAACKKQGLAYNGLSPTQLRTQRIGPSSGPSQHCTCQGIRSGLRRDDAVLCSCTEQRGRRLRRPPKFPERESQRRSSRGDAATRGKRWSTATSWCSRPWSAR
jgi:hypothetical protein